MDDDHIIELASSISAHGLLQPIVVKQGSCEKYQLLAGAHRLAACRRLNWDTIPAVVRKKDEGQPVKAVALLENILRKPMTLEEEVEAVSWLYNHDGASPSQICQLLSKGRAWVDRRLAIPNLEPSVIGPLFEGRLSLSAAEIISNVEHPGIRASILNEAIYANLSTRQVRDLAELAEDTPSLDEAIRQGVQTARELSGSTTAKKVCENCGHENPLGQMRAIWLCVPCIDGAPSDENEAAE